MQNILVVGGTKGIGYQIVGRLKNCHVTVVARERDELQDASIQFIQADVAQDTIDPALLPETLDGLVYCPGTINLKPFNRLTEADYLNDWQVNFMGAVRIISAALPNLKRSEHASIVLFSTVAVSIGMPYHASIAAAKGAVEGLTRSLAAELSPKIRVNCIAPSLTETPLAEKLLNTPEKREASAKRHALQRIGRPEDIADMACFLLSAQSGWMTGQVLHVDGGMSALKT
jgi:NAD(P)-dependent dehydrogenase (short-subunit alcohol dehydrogenase family)